ncbi:MAG: heparinase II/III family protein [Acidobacteriota bacterium]|nr:heparinase II/III family protein [Acidobacteriota bacterium]
MQSLRNERETSIIDTVSKVKQLRQLSLDELRVRSAQSLNSLFERRGWSSLAKLPTDPAFFQLLDARQTTREVKSAEELFEYFRARTAPSFFAGLSDREATVRVLRSTWPNAEKQIVERADSIVAGKFDLLGLRDLSFGDPIDWHLEPMSSKRAPREHWSQLDYLDADVTGDKKIVWELNRHQYFVTLGQAYWLTGDKRYAQTFVLHLSSWMDQNPPKLGINWASSLEASFRAISWLWAFYFFKDSTALTASLFLRTLKFIYLHARHLETYLSTYFSPNTHLTGEALGLFYVGTLLPEFHAAVRWRETGRRILLSQMGRHVQPDGVYFEQSSYYQRYTTEFYTHFLILSRLNKQPVPEEVEQRLKLLLDHLMHLATPEGTTPFFGDDDGGRLVMLDQRAANDFRPTLATGGALFRRGDYKYVAGEAAEQILWLLGSQGLAEFDRVAAHEPEKQSIAFADGGYYVMRDGWTRTANYLLLDCGPHGVGNCGHAHADALSFELAARGKTVLVDPGTYTYTASKEMRDWFRGSLAHNTLTVDCQSSSVPAGPFSWTTTARCQAQSWISRERFDYFEGKHDGYQRLATPVAHSRAVLFLKNDYWVIRDRVESECEHRYDLLFHFDAGIDSSLQACEGFAKREQATSGSAGLDIASFGRNAFWQTEEGSVSHCYGERVAAPVYIFSMTARGNNDLLTFLLPRTKTEPSPGVREVEAIGGRAFEVVSENAHDIVIIKTGERVEMARLASDFDWTWARFSEEGASVPEELVLMGGQRLELEGKEVLRSGRRIKYLVASRVGDQFRIETDDGVLDLRLPIRDFEAAFSNLKSQI